MKLRLAQAADADELFLVRTSVRENHESMEQLARIGVTPAAVAEMLASGKAGGWCVEEPRGIVGFSMARRPERDVFALFVLPECEGRGIGGALLDAAVAWLRDGDPRPVRLSTGRGTRAWGFYLARGWCEVGTTPEGDPILELPGEESAPTRS